MLITIPLKEINFRYIVASENLDERRFFDVSHSSILSHAVNLVRLMKVGYQVNYPDSEKALPKEVQSMDIFDDIQESITQLKKPSSDKKIVYERKIYMNDDEVELFDAFLSPRAILFLNNIIYQMLIKEMKDLAYYHKNKSEAVRLILDRYNFDGVIEYESLRKALNRSYISPTKKSRERKFEQKHLELCHNN